MGKYDHVLKTLPKVFFRDNDDPGHQARVNAVKEAVLQRTDEVPLLAPHNKADLLDGVDRRLRLLNADLMRRLDGRPATARILTEIWRDARDMKDRIDEIRSSTSLLVTAYEQLMIEAADAEDTGSVKDTDGRGVNIHYEPYVKTVDQEALRVWCDADKDLRLKMRLHASTLTSHVRGMISEGHEPPPGVEVKALAVARKAG